MQYAYEDDGLHRIYTGEDGDGGYDPGVVKAFRKRIQVIKNGRDERDIRVCKGNHYEKLEPPRDHQHSMRLNKQWRLILEWRGEGEDRVLWVIGIEDYH